MPVILFSFAALLTIASVFSGTVDVDPETLGEMTAYSLIISIIVSVIAIIIVFTSKKIKAVGIVLFILAFVSLITTNISGVVTWVLFFVAGIVAVRWKEELLDEETTKKTSTSIDILKERFAKGEINSKEFEEMKIKLEDNYNQDQTTPNTSFLKNHSSSISSASYEKRSSWWYLAPILIGIIGGVVAYFLLKKDDPQLAKNCLIVGAIISGVGFLIGFTWS